MWNKYYFKAPYQFVIDVGYPFNLAAYQYKLQGTNPTRSLAAFGQVGFQLSDNLKLEAGGRYKNRQPIDQPRRRAAIRHLLLSEQTTTSDNISYKVSLGWKASDDHYLYAFVATGFRPGGLNVPVGGQPAPFEPEKVTSYELGWKANLAGGKLRTTINGFYNDYKNFQVIIGYPTFPTFGIELNVPDSTRIYGFEAEAELHLGGFSLDAGINVLHSELGEFYASDPRGATTVACNPLTGPTSATCIALEGRRQTYAPDFTFNVGAQYVFELGNGDKIIPRANYGHVGDQWATLFENPARGDLLEPRNIVNAQLAWEHGSWDGHRLCHQPHRPALSGSAEQRALLRRTAPPVRDQGPQGVLTKRIAGRRDRSRAAAGPSVPRSFEGVMQPYGLTIDKFLDHAAKWFRDRQIVEADAGRVRGRIGYGDLRERSNLMSGALATLGMRPGDRVGTLAWNTQHHLEIYYAAMGVGLVCHTLNPRLTVAHLAAMINEAEDRILAVSADLMPILRELAPLCPGIEHVVVMDAPDAGDLAPHPARIWAYEALLEAHGAATAWGAFDENAPAGLCYTSGTTGSPKGVVYTHRSNYLHTLRALQAGSVALTGGDVLLLAVPMFHANGWGLPFAAPAAGTKLVLPGRTIDGPSLAQLMRDEGVTVAVGVQTVWLGLVDHLDATGGDLPALRRVLIGGSNCPDALLRRLEDRLGAEVQTSWGMTELSPIGTIAPPGTAAEARASGRPPMGLDLKLTDAEGNTLAPQRGILGHLKVKGHSVLDRYFRAESDALDGEGYFDTGDLAMIGADGDLTICGRSKDLIKSGGEWINPTEIEAIVGRHPGVRHVAVIGRPDARWGERPVLIVETQGGDDPRALIGLLRGKVADFWIPDQVAEIAAMPLAASGKIDKNRLRADYAEGKIAGERVVR
ncbi:MAG: TonB-dependent receptor [Sphingomonas sp.]